jgi:hypothetical protein
MPVVAAGLTWAKVEKMNTFTATCEPYTTAEICSCSAPDGGTRRLEDLDDGTEPLISDTSSWSRPKSWGMIRWLSVIIGVIACCIPVAAAFYVFKDYGDSDDSEIATMLGAGCCFCVILMLVVAYFYSGTPSPEYEAELEFVGESQQSIIAVGDVDEWMSLSEWHWKRWIGLLLMMCTCWGVFSVDDDDEKAAGILCCLLFLVAVILTTSAESAMTCPGGYGCDEICLSDPETCMAEQDLHPDWCSRHASLCPEFCKEHRDKCQMSGYIEPLVAQATTRLDGEWGHCTQPCGKNGTQLRQHYCPIAQTWHTYESNENMITMDGLHWLDEDVTNTEPDMWDEVDGQTVCIAVEETRSCNLFSCGCADQHGFQATPGGECELCPGGSVYDDTLLSQVPEASAYNPSAAYDLNGVQVPPNRDCEVPETFDSDDLCRGSISVNGFVCTECGLGKFTEQPGASECSTCPVGRHTMSTGTSSSTECLQCSVTSSGYPACMGGQCDPRHKDTPGTLCGECADNHYRSEFDCKECGNSFMTMVLALVLVLAFIGVPTYIIASTGSAIAEHADQAYGNYGAMESFSSACGQTQRFLEMVSPNFFWPRSWLAFAAAIKAIIAFDLPELAQPECQIEMSPSEGIFYRTLFVFFTIPFLSGCVMFALSAVNSNVLKSKHETKTHLWWTATVQIHSVLFLTVVKAGLQAFDCTDGVLDMNSAVACDINDPSYSNTGEWAWPPCKYHSTIQTTCL